MHFSENSSSVENSLYGIEQKNILFKNGSRSLVFLYFIQLIGISADKARNRSRTQSFRYNPSVLSEETSEITNHFTEDIANRGYCHTAAHLLTNHKRPGKEYSHMQSLLLCFQNIRCRGRADCAENTKWQSNGA